MSKSIYHSEEAKRRVLDLYDAQMEQLGIPYKDIYVETSFGRTHLIETGNLNGKPLLVFHGGNGTTAYNFKCCNFLCDDFHIYAVDTIGHPGKSAETCLSPKNLDYGYWTSEVITKLGFDKIACFGGSFGAGVLVKAMCVAPDKIERSALYVPSAIKNAPTYKSISMLFPMIMYWITHKEDWFIKCIMPMALDRENISADTLQTVRCSIDNCKIKKEMPQDESTQNLMKYTNPVLVIAAEKDCLFPGAGVIKRAKSIWKQGVFYLVEGKGHMHNVTPKEQQLLHDFLAGENED